MPSTGSRSWRCRIAQHRPAVGKRLVDGEVETVLALLHLRPVERAGAALDPDAAAGRALPGLVVDALLEEQQVDTAVGGRLERRAPAGGCAGVAAGLLLPALDGLGLLLAAPRLEQRLDELEQVGRRRVGVGARPPDDRLARLVREHVLELRARLLGGDDDQPRPAQPAQIARRRARRPPSGGRGRASRCAAGSATATSRPGRGGPASRRAGRRSPRAGRRADGRGRPRSRPTKMTSAPSPRPTSETSGAR